LREQIESLITHTEEQFPELIRSHKTVDKGHGRLETREIFALATHNMKLEIDGIKQVARLYREREILKSGKVETEEVFLITNMHYNELDEQGFSDLKREYWAIENKLHYRKDFVFGEDRSTIRVRYGPENMSNLRNFAIGLLMANNVKNVKRCVENIRYQNPAHFLTALHSSTFRKAA